MKALNYAILLFLVLLAGYGIYLFVTPDVYIISVEKIADYELRDNWVLQYAIDGNAEQAVFTSSEACEKYIEYLKDQGVMYD